MDTQTLATVIAALLGNVQQPAPAAQASAAATRNPNSPLLFSIYEFKLGDRSLYDRLFSDEDAATHARRLSQWVGQHVAWSRFGGDYGAPIEPNGPTPASIAFGISLPTAMRAVTQRRAAAAATPAPAADNPFTE